MLEVRSHVCILKGGRPVKPTFFISNEEVGVVATKGGPSPRDVAWRRFVIETLVCLVLLAALGVVWLRGHADLFAGSATVVLVGLILRIVWREDGR